MVENINYRIANMFDIFIQRAGACHDEESEAIFTETLQDFVARIEKELRGKLTEVDCFVLYETFPLLLNVSRMWRNDYE